MSRFMFVALHSFSDILRRLQAARLDAHLLLVRFHVKENF